jgi:lipoprotein-anchoring transpeptidase ErfK/SrfK
MRVRCMAGAALGMAALALLSGCTTNATPGQGVAAAAPPARVTTQPADSASEVSPLTKPAVQVAEGVLAELTLTASDGTPVPGTVGPDRRSWTANGPLDFGQTYTWAGTATAADGRATRITGSFRTITPRSLPRASINIGDDRTVGIAAPIIVQFYGRVGDRAAAERALSVSTSVPVEGSWAWLPDTQEGSRVHWRPRTYWPSGATVTVDARLFGVPYGEGSYGRENVTTRFTIGRSQIVKADVHSHHLVVLRDGQQIAIYPASYGLDSDPNRNTRSGIHVVTEKFTDERMVSQQYGYDVVEKWAVRISNNGEFIHANPATTGVQGSRNVSHGCVNLSTANAKEYYDGVLYGDPVEVTGSGVNLSSADGDIYDWAIPWSQWQAMSALG